MFCLTYVGIEFNKIIIEKNKKMWLAVFNVGFDLETYKQKAHVIYLVVCIINVVFNFILSGRMKNI